MYNSSEVKTILWQKIQKQQAFAAQQPEVCVQECQQEHNHAQEVFYGKRLAAAFQGFTLAEALQPIRSQERRNKSRRNILGPEEEDRLHDARRALRSMQPAA